MIISPHTPPPMRTLSWRSLRASLRSLPPEAAREFLATLRPELRPLLNDGWFMAAGDHQVPPDEADPWHAWLLLGGRGAGKTRAGAEWVMRMVRGVLGIAARPVGRIALVGETLADVRDVMIHGPSGLLAVAPPGERPQWKSSLRRLEWPNGALAHAFSAEDPDSLRGPQFEAAWCDELGKWRHAQETWDMLQFGLRLGHRPRQAVTTTPRRIPLIRRLMDDPSVEVTRARTADNAENLAPSFLAQVTAVYGGTRLGRQELEGELIEDRPDALWKREAIERARIAAAPALARIVVAVDPPATSGRNAGACGIVAAGVDAGGTGYVIADATVSGAAPEAWAARAAALYRRLEADALVAEVNQGGEMVAAVVRVVDPAVPVTTVVATRAKYARAEPVSTLYAQGRVRHVGAYPALEDEMCDFGPAGLSNGRSPDRLDALVWALTHLMLGAEPRVRVL
jgi:phage terminase large subunit-like protein